MVGFLRIRSRRNTAIERTSGSFPSSFVFEYSNYYSYLLFIQMLFLASEHEWRKRANQPTAPSDLHPIQSFAVRATRTLCCRCHSRAPYKGKSCPIRRISPISIRPRRNETAWPSLVCRCLENPRWEIQIPTHIRKRSI